MGLNPVEPAPSQENQQAAAWVWGGDLYACKRTTVPGGGLAGGQDRACGHIVLGRRAGRNREIPQMLYSPLFPLSSQGKAGEPGLPGPEGARGPPVSAKRV